MVTIEPYGNPLGILVSRHCVEDQDTGPVLSVFRRLTESPEVARANMERVDISFDAYDNRRDELHEIVEVRNYVYRLDEEFPFWLFFLSKYGLGLQCVMHCFLPPSLTEEAKARIRPKRLEQLLLDRWFPAMNHISQFAGLTGPEIAKLTERVMMYVRVGRLPIPHAEQNTHMRANPF
jgi:hypothetical protein